MGRTTIGDRIKLGRFQNGLTQADLAGKLRVSQATISHWEAGKGTPDEEQLTQLESILGPGLSSAQAMLTITGGPSIAGAWLSKAREQKGLTPAELAQRAGVSIPTIYNIESGRAQFPRRRTIERLEKALDTPFDLESARELREASEIKGLGDFEDFDPYEEEDWPDAPGVYVLYDISERPIYVGQAKNIARRIRNHEDKFWFKRPIVDSASYVPIKEETLRRQIESILIRFLKSNAVLNQQQVERE